MPTKKLQHILKVTIIYNKIEKIMSKITNTEKPSRIGTTLRNGSSIPDYKYTTPPPPPPLENKE